jgi:predicted nucleic acid-binding Zn ribbon protein
MRRLISAPAFQFKGSGWYVTDYARKGTAGSSSGKGNENGGGAKAAKSADAKGSGHDVGTKGGKETPKES